MGRLRSPDMSDVGQPSGDLTIIALPGETFRALSNAAAERNMDIYTLLARALNHYLEETAGKPRLLTEGE